LLCGALSSVRADVSVLTQHNDNARTGANLQETLLTTQNVNTAQFGKLFARAVDGQIYAQPLYLSNVNIGGKQRNVVFVATLHNTVYAFDADAPDASAPLWQINLGTSVDILTAFGSAMKEIDKEIGIVGTPVLSPETGLLYVVAATQDANGGPYHQLLYALNIYTGQPMKGSPIEIAGSVNGKGAGSSGGVLAFNPLKHLQRSALLLLNGVVYITFCSHGDQGPYHGWVFAYDAATLEQAGIFCTTPDGTQGGIWMSGQGPAADADGHLYLMTGNGSFNADQTTGRDYGDSFLKLRLEDSTFQVLDSFTPYNQAVLSAGDTDLGSSGPALLPGTPLIVGGGKDGFLHLIDRTAMGGYNSLDNSQIVQSFKATNGHIHGSPVYWNGPNGPMIYLWGENDALKAFRLVNGVFATTPAFRSAMYAPRGMPGGMLAISANGSTAGTGILWASLPFSGDANMQTQPGLLRAFDASTLTELWNSRQNAARDDLGNFAKFCCPTIANGKVYLATFSNQLVVYGLFVPMPQITPGGGTSVNSVRVTLSDPVAGTTLRYTLDGSDPTATSTAYSSPLLLTRSALLKVRGFKAGYAPSAVAQARFTILQGARGGKQPGPSPIGPPRPR
ncbi:MAG TPA: chitobiase/beta-hexosaminidase C-terminal domain-containing protein, partial [Chthonomonadaceae bacterium]|nr:chitobiase/beta-hexosaminidase C-terminal domain-containing protein [Chthonomonadaceae bacterium]